jgi:hypothetical protein
MSRTPDINTRETIDRIELDTAVECAENGDLGTSPLSIFSDGGSNEPAERDEPNWLQRLFDADDSEGGSQSLLAGESSPFPPMFFGDEREDTAPTPGESFTPEPYPPAPALPSRASRPPRTYTLEHANRLRELMRAAPDKDPNQRRMDKQAIVKHVVDEITALQERGYTLEEVAEMLSTGGVTLTLPTLKSYLSRTRKASRKTGKSGAAARGATPRADAARPPRGPC